MHRTPLSELTPGTAEWDLFVSCGLLAGVPSVLNKRLALSGGSLFSALQPDTLRCLCILFDKQTRGHRGACAECIIDMSLTVFSLDYLFVCLRHRTPKVLVNHLANEVRQAGTCL